MSEWKSWYAETADDASKVYPCNRASHCEGNNIGKSDLLFRKASCDDLLRTGEKRKEGGRTGCAPERFKVLRVERSEVIRADTIGPRDILRLNVNNSRSIEDGLSGQFTRCDALSRVPDAYLR